MNNWKKIKVTILLLLFSVLFEPRISLAAMSAEKFIEICATENPKRIRQAVKRGARIDGQDQAYGWTPLMHMAALATKPSTIKTLVQLGAQVEAQSAVGETPLLCAVLNNSNISILDVLVNLGANVDTPSKTDGTTPLMAACMRKGNRKAVEFLVKHGANVNAVSNNGVTALMIAAQDNSSTTIIEYLLKHGADRTLKDSNGTAAYQYLNMNKNLTRQIKNRVYKLLFFSESASSSLHIKQNIAPELNNEFQS